MVNGGVAEFEFSGSLRLKRGGEVVFFLWEFEVQYRFHKIGYCISVFARAVLIKYLLIGD